MSFPTLQIHVVAAVFRFTPHRFTTPHITPFRSLRFITLHSFSSYSPCLSHRTVRAKKSAKPAAGSTRPQRPALSVSGALTPLAAARTQPHKLHTSFRFSTLAFQPCYPHTLKAVLPFKKNPRTFNTKR
jgi:hypothetical protein